VGETVCVSNVGADLSAVNHLFPHSYKGVALCFGMAGNDHTSTEWTLEPRPFLGPIFFLRKL